MAILGTAMAIALFAAGCGSGDGGSDGDRDGTIATSSLSRSEFVKQANAICAREKGKVLGKISTYYRQHPAKGKSELEQFTAMTSAIVLPTIENELAEIRGLGAPSGEEARIEAILDAEHRAVDEVAKLRVVHSRFEIERHFAEAARLAWGYGMGPCANAPDPRAGAS